MTRVRIIAAATIIGLVLFSPSARTEEVAGVTGEIINLDEVEAGKITIKHTSIPKLGIREDDKVTDFRPKDKGLFGRVKAGDKVRFTVEQINGELTITKLDRQ